MSGPPMMSPAPFVPLYGVSYSSAAGDAVPVASSTPMPVSLARGTDVLPSPMTGTATTTVVVGPFAPAFGYPVMLSLSGTWVGSVSVLRSIDGGVTQLPLTVSGLPWARFTANCCESIWHESDASARLYLSIAVTSGSLTYRMGH